MACTYQVAVDGAVVWTHETDEYEGLATFPEEYRGRPDSGEVMLIVNDEVVAVQRPLDPSDPAATAPRVNVVSVEG